LKTLDWLVVYGCSVHECLTRIRLDTAAAPPPSAGRRGAGALADRVNTPFGTLSGLASYLRWRPAAFRFPSPLIRRELLFKVLLTGMIKKIRDKEMEELFSPQ